MKNISDEAYEGYQRGLLTWPEVQRLEQEAQPRCACGKPTNAVIDDGPICAECLDALYRTVSDTHERISARKRR